MKRIQRRAQLILFEGALAVLGAAVFFPAPGQNAAQVQPQAKSVEKTDKNEIYGTIREIKGSKLTVETRTGKSVQVDATGAVQGHRCVPLVVGQAIDAVGTVDKAGVFHAESIQHAKQSSAVWPPDR